MKQIKNTEIKFYEIDDFLGNEKLKDGLNRVITEQIEFETEIRENPFPKAVKECEKMQTPWFFNEYVWEYYQDEIIETIRINNYLFDKNGEFIPVVYHTKNNKVVRTELFDCEIELVDCETVRV